MSSNSSNKEYHDFLQFLYFEGYAESYAEAEELLESMSDEEFEELNEKRLAHSFPLKPSERRSVENIRAMLDGKKPKSTETRSARMAPPEDLPKRKRTTNMSKVIVAQYLFDEEYADSYAEAEELLESMSDEEFEEIIYEAKSDNRLRADQKEIIRNRRLSPGQRLPVRGETPADTENRLTQTRRKRTAEYRGGRGERGSQGPKYRKNSEYGGVTYQKDVYPEKVSARLKQLRAKTAQNNIRSFREEVVEYLFVEGFADTIENAEVMAENISEQWIDEILNEMEVQPPKEPLKTDRNMFNIPADEKEAARERTLAKAKAMRAKKGIE